MVTRLMAVALTAFALLAAPLLAPAQQLVTCASSYTVQPGDTLMGIATTQYGTADLFQAIVIATNAQTGGSYTPITDLDSLQVGQVLCIPSAADAMRLLAVGLASAPSVVPAAPAPAAMPPVAARPPASAPPVVQPNQGMTVDMLRQGGYVIFFRHATSDVGSDAAAVIVEDCTTQRNMSEAGLRDARTIGQAFRMLNIPVGDVLSSEYCRALETAHVAFGRAQREMMLNFCCADNRPLSQDQRFAWLERALATLPPQGMNTVLVGHGVGIMADLAMGEAAIYAPDGRGGFVRVARVLPAEWMSGVYPPGGMR